MYHTVVIWLCWLQAVVVGFAPGTTRAADPPNILIITADNLGYGDLQMYNADSRIRTPQLDALAAAGARLTDFYTASPTCTVSRACLLTGRIPQRHGLDRQLAGVAGNYGVGLNQNEVLIPALLKAASTPYATGCFGKWNIGFAEGSRPTERGFDAFKGHASGNLDYYRHNYRERHDLFSGIEPWHQEGKYSTDLFASAAVDFIRHHSEAEEPWFCYLAFNSPHFPVAANKPPGEPNRWQAPDWALEEYGWSADEPDPQKRYAAVVTALDRAIGIVLKTLDEVQATNTTFVFFMSDNGAFRLGRDGIDVGINDPLRQGGVTCWEGGIRVVAVARWPGQIPAGSVVSQPLWTPDLMVACVELAGAPLPQRTIIDGRNPLPALTGQGPSPHQSLFFEYRDHAALRMGDWKVVRERPDQAWQLFNLKQDIQETTDLAQETPTQLKTLAEEFSRWQASFND